MKSIGFNQQSITSKMIYFRENRFIYVNLLWLFYYLAHSHTIAGLYGFKPACCFSFACFYIFALLFVDRICNILRCSLILFIANKFTPFYTEHEHEHEAHFFRVQKSCFVFFRKQSYCSDEYERINYSKIGQKRIFGCCLVHDIWLMSQLIATKHVRIFLSLFYHPKSNYMPLETIWKFNKIWFIRSKVHRFWTVVLLLVDHMVRSKPMSYFSNRSSLST